MNHILRPIGFLVVAYLAFAPVPHQQSGPQVAGSSATFKKATSPVCNEQQSQKICECNTPDRTKPEVKAGMNVIGQLCGKAISLPKPTYPEEAKRQKISGVVQVEIVIDEQGDVIWAKPIEGHPLLRESSLRAACLSRHSPYRISGEAVKASGFISYNFLSE